MVYTFIGGIVDGRKLEVPDAMESVQIERIYREGLVEERYYKDRICFGDGPDMQEIWFYRACDILSIDAVWKLFNSYKPKDSDRLSVTRRS